VNTLAEGTAPPCAPSSDEAASGGGQAGMYLRSIVTERTQRIFDPGPEHAHEPVSLELVRHLHQQRAAAVDTSGQGGEAGIDRGG